MIKKSTDIKIAEVFNSFDFNHMIARKSAKIRIKS
jgi:hypothetical protein